MSSDFAHVGLGSPNLGNLATQLGASTPPSFSISLNASPASPSAAQQVTLTATVSVNSPGAGTPTGTITFKDGSTTLGTAALSTTNGVTSATFTTATFAVGTHSITASYSGDGNDLSSSGTFSQVVNKDTTTTTLASSVAPSVFGQSVTFTATVSVSSPGVGTPR